jgi:multisubunit Na+/H+ antiporter MnhB subunit
MRRFSFLPAIVVILLVLALMFKPLKEGDKVAGSVLLVAVVLSGLATLIGGISRGRNRYYRNNRNRRY